MGRAKKRASRRRKASLEKPGVDSALTAEADRFAAERVRAQLSTTPVDEAAAEELLRAAYAAAGLDGPGHVHWLDGPLELAAILTGKDGWVFVEDRYRDRVPHCAWDDARLDSDEIACLQSGALESVDYRVRQLLRRAEESIHALTKKTSAGERVGARVEGGIWGRVVQPVWESVRVRVGERIWRAVADAAHWPVSPWIRDSIWGSAEYGLWDGIRAYDDAPLFAEVRFYDERVAQNEAHALARFNELASGYWLGRAVAFVVRRPRLLSLDARGRLHSEMGPCVEYRDGWGFWAWRGVVAPEKAILAPDELTRDDFLGEENVEARRFIQERMGARFVPELGGRFIDAGTRGVLYEVELPEDPEHVARYLQVQDPSTGRVYYLRVPPEIATAEEAVAWTFGLAAGEYRPAQET